MPVKPRFTRAMLPATSSVAAAFLATGCAPSADRATTDVAICRNGAGQRVADSDCDRNRTGGGGGAGGGGRLYYIGSGERVPAIGETVSGGSDVPRAGVSYMRASPATVSRGGFGGSADAAGE